jgi:serine/threonine protein kinase
MLHLSIVHLNIRGCTPECWGYPRSSCCLGAASESLAAASEPLPCNAVKRVMFQLLSGNDLFFDCGNALCLPKSAVLPGLKALHACGVCIGSIAPVHIHFNENSTDAWFGRLPSAHLKRFTDGEASLHNRQHLSGRFDSLSPEAVSGSFSVSSEANDVWALAACVVSQLLGGLCCLVDHSLEWYFLILNFTNSCC